LEYLALQIQTLTLSPKDRNNLLQALVPFLQRFQLRQLRATHATELLAPGAVGRIANPARSTSRSKVRASSQL
jgi:hypothetical protein